MEKTKKTPYRKGRGGYAKDAKTTSRREAPINPRPHESQKFIGRCAREELAIATFVHPLRP
jgi:hypothetical protein